MFHENKEKNQFLIMISIRHPISSLSFSPYWHLIVLPNNESKSSKNYKPEVFRLLMVY